MNITIDQEVPVPRGYAAARTLALYNVDAQDGSRFKLEAEIPTEDTDWSIGVIVGPSGSGKSSIGRKLRELGWTEWTGGQWDSKQPIIEVLGADNYAKATSALAAVGLGSVPSWLRPYRVLSTGEAFRADMAALLLSDTQDAYIDEYTSVLDRTVAQVAAGAFAKSWRRKEGRRVILLTCHFDILGWVQPDWVVNTGAVQSLDGNKADTTRDALTAEAVVRSASADGPTIGTLRWRVNNG